MNGIDMNDIAKLNELPLLDPPRDGWSEIRSALENDRHESSRKPWAGLAAAAVLLLALSLIIALPQQPGEVVEELSQQQRLVQLSQGMEQRLADYRRQVSTLPTDQTLMITELEDMVAQLDLQLGENPANAELWYKRVTLMADMLGIYAMHNSGEMGLIASL